MKEKEQKIRQIPNHAPNIDEQGNVLYLDE